MPSIPVEAAASNGSIPNIFGKLQSIDDVSAERQSRQSWDRGGTDDKIAHEQAYGGPRRKSAAKILGASLLGFDVGPQKGLVSLEGFLSRSVRRNFV